MTVLQNDACCLTPEEARTLDSAVFKALIQEEGQWESLEWRALGLMRHHHQPCASRSY